jgi:hypothetical protein
MFESVELPRPDEIARLDDLGLVDAVTLAMLVESVAVEVRLAAIDEMSTRLHPVASNRPCPPRLATAPRPPSKRQRRRRRKRKRRR